MFFIAYTRAALTLETRYLLSAYLHVDEVIDQGEAATRFPRRENVILERLAPSSNVEKAVLAYIDGHASTLAWPEAREILSSLAASPSRFGQRADDFVARIGNRLFVHAWWDPHDDWRARLKQPYIVGGSDSTVLVSPVPYVDLQRQVPALPRAEQLRTKIGYMYRHIQRPVPLNVVPMILSVIGAS